MLIETATIMEVSIAVGGILAALAGLIKSSACRVIKCGLTGFSCVRHPTKGERVETDSEGEIATELTSKSPNPLPSQPIKG